MSQLLIGTSGWNYDHWKNGFYKGVPRKDWLGYYAEWFPAVEVNATFYRLQKAATLARWHDATPASFRFTIKGNRYLTHNKKLRDPAESVAIEREHARPLGDKLAVVLWQLPGNLEKRLDRLEAFCEALAGWPEVRHAVELRHTSWFDEETRSCLEAHGVANCLSDAADWPMWRAVASDLVYVRLHGHTRTYASAYGSGNLRKWAQSIRGWLGEGRQVHVYFDNDAEGAAPRDAMKLAKLVSEHADRQ